MDPSVLALLGYLVSVTQVSVRVAELIERLQMENRPPTTDELEIVRADQKAAEDRWASLRGTR